MSNGNTTISREQREYVIADINANTPAVPAVMWVSVLAKWLWSQFEVGTLVHRTSPFCVFLEPE